MENFKEWGPLKHIKLKVEIEEEFDTTIISADIPQLTSKDRKY